MLIDPYSLQTIILRSASLHVEIEPEQGGRVSSIRSLRSGTEFLTQSLRRNPTVASMEARFEMGFCAGIEECLPSVGRCDAGTLGGPVPDHGDFWQIPWHVADSNGAQATLWSEGFSRPLRLEKTLEVNGDSMYLRYVVRNIGEDPTSFLYAWHPLFKVDPEDKVWLPDEVKALRIDYSRFDRLGRKSDAVGWPGTETGVDLSQVLAPEAQTADMLYTSRLQRGLCRLERKRSGESLELSFDVERLPYLGVWLCFGGWPGNGYAHQQYAVALEPTSSPWNTLEEAQRFGQAVILDPDAVYSFVIQLRVSTSAGQTPAVNWF